VAVVLGIRHRFDARAMEDLPEQFAELVELRSELLKDRLVVPPHGSTGEARRRGRIDLSREVEDEPLPAQAPLLHRLPVAGEALVACAARPDVRRLRGLLVIAQQLGAVVGVAEPLHLQPQLLVKAAEHERDLVLERVQMLGRGGAELRRFDEEAFGDVAAFGEAVEDDKVAEEIAVWGGFNHGRESRGYEWWKGSAAPGRSRGL
jgi:hypothetical protein